MVMGWSVSQWLVMLSMSWLMSDDVVVQWAYRQLHDVRKEGSTLVIWGEKDVVTPFEVRS
jgi:hypothetical protein